jgi:hypothetical protein
MANGQPEVARIVVTNTEQRWPLANDGSRFSVKRIAIREQASIGTAAFRIAFVANGTNDNGNYIVFPADFTYDPGDISWGGGIYIRLDEAGSAPFSVHTW